MTRAIGFFQADFGYPAIISVRVEDTALREFICTFDSDLMDIIPPASAFSIAGLTVTDVAKTGDREITVSVNEDASHGVDYVLCYTKQIIS